MSMLRRKWRLKTQILQLMMMMMGKVLYILILVHCAFEKGRAAARRIHTAQALRVFLMWGTCWGGTWAA